MIVCGNSPKFSDLLKLLSIFCSLSHDIIFANQSNHYSHASQFPLKLNEPPHDKTNKMACVPSENLDQPVHLPSLISLRCPHEESFGPLLPTERTAKTLIRLGGCPGWSESLLGAPAILLVLWERTCFACGWPSSFLHVHLLEWSGSKRLLENWYTLGKSYNRSPRILKFWLKYVSFRSKTTLSLWWNILEMICQNINLISMFTEHRSRGKQRYPHSVSGIWT